MRNKLIRLPGGGTIGIAATLSLLALSGCDRLDPLTRPYMWHATGINAHNIAAQAVDPHDLVRGRDAARRRVVIESDAVDRVWAGRPVPLITDAPGAAASSGSSAGSGTSPVAGGG